MKCLLLFQIGIIRSRNIINQFYSIVSWNTLGQDETIIYFSGYVKYTSTNNLKIPVVSASTSFDNSMPDHILIYSKVKGDV